MSLLLSLSFFLLAVFGRIAIHYFYTGDHGLRFAQRSSPLIQILPGALFLASFAAHMILILTAHFGLFEVHTVLPEYFVAAAALLAFAGISVTVLAQIQMGRSWRIGVDQNETTELITTGLYSRSRNPIYFGILLYWIGICITFPHWTMFLCAIVCWFNIELIVRRIEEPYLQLIHGDSFHEYCRNTNRYSLNKS